MDNRQEEYINQNQRKEKEKENIMDNKSQDSLLCSALLCSWVERRGKKRSHSPLFWLPPLNPNSKKGSPFQRSSFFSTHTLLNLCCYILLLTPLSRPPPPSLLSLLLLSASFCPWMRMKMDHSMQSLLLSGSITVDPQLNHIHLLLILTLTLTLISRIQAILTEELIPLLTITTQITTTTCQHIALIMYMQTLNPH